MRPIQGALRTLRDIFWPLDNLGLCLIAFMCGIGILTAIIYHLALVFSLSFHFLG